MDGPARTALTTSVLGTVRVFIILAAGFAASKFPKQEREWMSQQHSKKADRTACERPSLLSQSLCH